MRCTKITVGVAENNDKVVELPTDGMVVSPVPANWQDPAWQDRFTVEVTGKLLRVTRVDSDEGWGQELVFNASYAPSDSFVPIAARPAGKLLRRM